MSVLEFPQVPPPPCPNAREKHVLAGVAWRALEAAVRGQSSPDSEFGGGLLGRSLGVFVTLFAGRELRGNSGSAHPSGPLVDAVGRSAAEVVRSGTDVPALEPAELAALRMEISCLGELVPLPGDAGALLVGLRPGEHGVCLEQGERRGVVLPQEARGAAWNAHDLLDAAAEKAGLAPGAWRDGGVRLLAFCGHSFQAFRPQEALTHSSPAPAPATAAGVLGRLRGAGLLPRHRLGQHFLHDPKLLEALVRDAAVGPEDTVFEVGTGPATLTRVLAARAQRVLTVEVDPPMMAFAKAELAGLVNVTFLERDVLDGSGHLDPEVCAQLRSCERFVWVSNLPYQVATRLVVQVCEQGLVWSRASLLVQHEVALRLAAVPGGRAYGPATALLAYWVRDRTRGRRIPAGAFWPPPRVDGSVILLSEVVPMGQPEEYPAYAACVRRLFGGRRKQLQRLFREILGPENVERALQVAGCEPRARPESLGPVDFLNLSREFPFLFLDSPS
jgi:16S rRNA (adenine1518-N6/adenine1519-N6)-dimethyltransferase